MTAAVAAAVVTLRSRKHKPHALLFEHCASRRLGTEVDDLKLSKAVRARCALIRICVVAYDFFSLCFFFACFCLIFLLSHLRDTLLFVFLLLFVFG